MECIKNYEFFRKLNRPSKFSSN